MTDTDIVITKDGSKTLFSKQYGECYHSINGAYQESLHIFINLGLNNFKNKNINILEIGYGTGLNAMLSFEKNTELNNNIFYHGIDILPINYALANELDYTKFVNIDNSLKHDFFDFWNTEIIVNEKFLLFKDCIDFKDFKPVRNYDLIYFDAFSPNVQQQMWSKENLEKIVSSMNLNAIFVTYCSRGIVKQTLRDLGLQVKRLQGPVGKRHVLFATKFVS